MGLVVVSWPVHQDVRGGGPYAGREVLPGQGAGQGLRPDDQTRGQTDLRSPALPYGAPR